MSAINVSVFIFVTIFGCATAKIDYCAENKFNISSLKGNCLQFAKELSSSEFATSATTFKSLHCCAKGYRSIEWYKDERPYPWAGDVSTFILYPEAANQTIYTQGLIPSDSGNYTCRAGNGTHMIQHSLYLTVFETRNYMDEPLPTYTLPSEHFIHLDETARLFCEAFVGRTELPDVENRIIWSRPGMNITQLEEDDRIHTSEVMREDNQIIGAYFYINGVKRDDFGEYKCSVSNSDDQIIHLTTILKEMEWSDEKKVDPVPWTKVIFIISAICLILFSLAEIHNRFSDVFYIGFFSFIYVIRQRISNYGRREDEAEYDVLICYHDADRDFVLNRLATRLQNERHYKILCKELADPSLTVSVGKQCRSLLVVASPVALCGSWTPANIMTTLRQVRPLHSRIVFLPMQTLPSRDACKTAEGIELISTLKQMKIVDGTKSDRGQSKLFWLTLLLALPVLRQRQVVQPLASSSAKESVAENSNKIKLVQSKSNDSLEVLV